MKIKFFRNTINLLPAIIIFTACVLFYSCAKDSDGSNFSKVGTPAFLSISNDSAANGAVIYVTGTGLGDIRSIIFDKENVPARITPTLNTSSSIIFNVPDTAKGGQQNIILTNSNGQSITIPFKVMAFAKVTASAPAQDFITGTELTLTGVNLDDVTDVKLTGSTDHPVIVSKGKKQLVLKMPATTKHRATLDITNATGTSTTALEFVSVENAKTVYTDQLDNNFQSWSWSLDNANFGYTTDKICGTRSFYGGYTGAWGGIQLGNGSLDVSDRTYLTFYAKGVDVDVPLQMNLNWGGWKDVTVPKNVWTYFRLKISDIAPGVTTVTFVNFQIKGDPYNVIFDDIMFIK